ncbi:MAG: hypothetical protein JKY95_01300 [Planctomycetaceae bacterium]|nr:hypothetical protein [Planctomycetaceae bacterium]
MPPKFLSVQGHAYRLCGLLRLKCMLAFCLYRDSPHDAFLQHKLQRMVLGELLPVAMRSLFESCAAELKSSQIFFDTIWKFMAALS